ncbi:hypothetical protein AKJ16_DCAP05685, partial [Drosera capensis]
MRPTSPSSKEVRLGLGFPYELLQSDDLVLDLPLFILYQRPELARLARSNYQKLGGRPVRLERYLDEDVTAQSNTSFGHSSDAKLRWGSISLSSQDKERCYDRGNAPCLSIALAMSQEGREDNPGKKKQQPQYSEPVADKVSEDTAEENSEANILALASSSIATALSSATIAFMK